jgi:hypothetical protein
MRSWLLPCFWSSTMLVVSQWLSAAILRSLCFDYPCANGDAAQDLASAIVVLIGFQIALWLGNAEYLVVCRQIGMKHWWMLGWLILFWGSFWDVPFRVIYDLAWSFDGELSFVEDHDWDYSLRKIILVLMGVSSLPLLLWLLPLKFIDKVSRIRVAEKVWRLPLAISIRTVLVMTTVIAVVSSLELQWGAFSNYVGEWVLVALFFISIFVKLTAWEQEVAWKSNGIQLLLWLGTGVLFFLAWRRRLSHGIDTLDVLLMLLIGYYFGRLMILVVRLLDRFPPIINPNVVTGGISRRTALGFPVILLFLVILVGSQVGWYLFSGRYQPSILVCGNEDAFEKARVVAFSSQLLRSAPIDKDFVDDSPRFFEVGRDRSLLLSVSKAVTRDARWVSLAHECEVGGLDITWDHSYPQDNPAFFNYPHVSLVIDVDAISPGSRDWHLVMAGTNFNREKTALYGGFWTAEMFESVRKNWTGYLGLIEPRFPDEFSRSSFAVFDHVVIVFLSAEPIFDQTDLLSEVVKEGVDLVFRVSSEHEARLAAQRIKEMPQFKKQIDVLSGSKSVLISRIKVTQSD